MDWMGLYLVLVSRKGSWDYIYYKGEHLCGLDGIVSSVS